MIFLSEVGLSGVDSAAQFLTVLVIFVIVLLITRYTLKWAGKYQKFTSNNRNFEVIETFKVTSNKYLQLIRAGEKYLVISIGKDEINILTELSKDEIDFGSAEASSDDGFAKLLSKAKEHVRKKGDQ